MIAHLGEALYILALVLANAFFVAAEFALVKVRVGKIDTLAAKGNWAAKLTSKALDRLDAYLSASQLGITVASLALGQAMKDKIEPALAALIIKVAPGSARFVSGPSAIAAVPLITLSIVTFFHMTLGEQAPKNLAIRRPGITALCTAPVLVAFHYLFYPIIMLLNWAGNLTLSIIGLGKASQSELTHTEEELRHVLAESAAGGHLSRSERTMIENVLNLEEKTARRIMVPRPDIVYLSLSRPLDENLSAARQSGHTRFPLCEDDLTTVLGMIHVKDLFRAVAAAAGRPDLKALARELPFVPESLTLDQLLLRFQKNRVHLAMLVDEYGEVVGMVTLENVLEELVGPIQDEFDREIPPIRALENSRFEVEAACPLEVLGETTQIPLPETDAATAGGLVVDLLGRLAREGDRVRVDGYVFIVTQADPTRIRRILIEPAPAPAPAPSGDPSPPS